MSDITNETDRIRRAQDKVRKAQRLREMVASLDKVIGRPHDPKPPGLAVLISDAIANDEIANTKADL